MEFTYKLVDEMAVSTADAIVDYVAEHPDCDIVIETAAGKLLLRGLRGQRTLSILDVDDNELNLGHVRRATDDGDGVVTFHVSGRGHESYSVRVQTIHPYGRLEDTVTDESPSMRTRINEAVNRKPLVVEADELPSAMTALARYIADTPDREFRAAQLSSTIDAINAAVASLTEAGRVVIHTQSGTRYELYLDGEWLTLSRERQPVSLWRPGTTMVRARTVETDNGPRRTVTIGDWNTTGIAVWEHTETAAVEA